MLTFDKSPAILLDSAKALVTYGRSEVDRIVLLKELPSFSNVIKPIALLEAKMQVDSAKLTFPQYVSEDKELRDASSEALKILEDFRIEKNMRKDLYDVVLKVKGQNEKLEGEDERLLSKLLVDFERNGLFLPEKERNELSALKKQLSELCIKFSSNLNEDKSRLLFSRTELDGCTVDFINSLNKELDSNGEEKFVVTMKYPDVAGIMKYAKSESTRKSMDFANGTKSPENIAILEEAIEIRKKIAHILRFKNHAELRLIDEMAKTPEAVCQFLSSLCEKLQPFGKEELKKLTLLKEADKKSRNEVFDGKFYAWDFQYYHRILLETEHKIDEQKIKEYFSFESVTKEMLNIYQELLGLKFELLPNPDSWNADVRFYKVSDAASNELIGHFYLDLFPRDGKYTHAACFGLIPGYVDAIEKRQTPLCAIVANFGKPTANKPSLLTQVEVVTYFHELGHAMHQLCASTKYARFHGTNVETDFVEAPSQMLENWCFNKTALNRLSKHFESGQPLPVDMINSIIKAKNVNSGLFYLRQLFFGNFDMAIHTSDSPVNTTSLYSHLKSKIALIDNQEGTWPAASFGHMMGGCTKSLNVDDAGYYGYLWSQVFSADMFFSRFGKEGIDNLSTGMDYRKCILQPGGSRDGMDMIKKFLGREPNDSAFLKSIGLEK